MFKINKYLMMLGLCATPFVMAGCPGDDEDGDTAGDTDTATATATDTATATATDTATATATATDTATATATDTATATATDTTPTTDTDSGTDTTPTTDTDTDSGTDSGTDTGPDGVGACVPGCANSDECCTIFNLPAECADMFNGYTCNDEMYCELVGCADDQECIDYYGALNLDYDTCLPEGNCAVSCEEDTDCDGTFPEQGYTCVDNLCTAPENPPCESNEDCLFDVTGLQCDVDTGFCVECFEDAECADSDFGAVCDTEIGFCGCNDAADCAFRGDLCI